MAEQTPTAADIELIERRRTTEDSAGGSAIIPNEVRIKTGNRYSCRRTRR